MKRITMSIDDELLATLDARMARRGYASRSEALRDILREAQAGDRLAGQPSASCVATLSYVYDHETRELGRRLTHAQHEHHDLSVATMHVHLDHTNCLEVAVLRGPAQSVRALADATVTQRGVRYGHLHVVPARIEDARHAHGARQRRHRHVHA